MRQRSDGMVAGGPLVTPLWHKPPFEDWCNSEMKHGNSL